MRKYPIIAFLLVHHLVSGQITITSTTFPAPGDTLRYKIAQNQGFTELYTPPGGNQVWDISNITPTQTVEEVYRPASEGAAASNYPGAEMFSGNAAGEVYFNLTTNKVERLGFTGGIFAFLGANAKVSYSPPLVEREAPLNFFDIDQSSSDISLPIATADLPAGLIDNIPGSNFLDSIRIRQNTIVLAVSDAYGTLKIPGTGGPVTYPVLRQKTTTYVTSTIDAHSFLGWVSVPLDQIPGNNPLSALTGTDTITAYVFWNDSSKEFIAKGTTNADQNQFTSLQIKNTNGAVNTTPGLAFSILSFRIYPNPANDQAQLDLSGLPDGNYQLNIYDLAGKMAHTQLLENQKKVVVSVGSLPNGVYNCKIKDLTNGKWAAQQLLVEH